MHRSEACQIDPSAAARLCRTLLHRLVAGTATALLLAALAAAGAGNVMSGTVPAASPEASPSASPAAAPVAHATSPSTQIITGSITIAIYDDGMEPGHFESAVGRDVTITVTNRGKKPHNFSIERLDVDIDVKPGETKTVKIAGPALGNYRYYSDLPGDEGLEGVMTVFI